MANLRVSVDVASDGDQLAEQSLGLSRDRGSAGRRGDGSLHRLSLACGRRVTAPSLARPQRGD